MSRKKTGIIVILIVIVGVIVVLARVIPKGKTGEVKNNKTAKQLVLEQQAEHAQQVAEYQQNIKSIAVNYQNIINAVNADSASTGSISQISALSEIKNKLTSITVPTEFKDLHMDFFLSVLDLENYFKNNQLSAKAKSSKLWQALQKDYSWITK
jgi:hypothetical protein